MFDISSLHNSGTVLVKSSFLSLSLMFALESNTKVKVGQIVEGGELIFLDAIDIVAEAGEETVVQLDITHAVHGWVDNPSTNLGLRVSFDTETDLPLLMSPPSIRVDSQHSWVAR